MSTDLESKCWAVMRQGESGNPWIVKAPLTETEADSQVAHFGSLGHKQTYWKTQVGSEDYQAAKEEGCF